MKTLILSAFCFLLPAFSEAGTRRVRHINPGSSGATFAVDARWHTAADGDAVSTWTDRTVSANNVTGSGGARPTYKTAILGGAPVMRFASASSQIMTFGTALSASGAWTVIAVGSRANSSTLWFLGLSAAGGVTFVPYVMLFGSDNTFYLCNNPAFKTSTGTYGATTAVFYAASSADRTTLTGSVNGVTPTFNSGSTGEAHDFGKLGGRTGQSPQYTNGDIGAVIYFPTQISAPLHRRFQQALAFSFKISQ
ncbi:MAG: hypothetical protein K8R87_01110 [Verrucomicrobia bacterium]|nr:hypothetical protein [Verrucomicrobiota bacterium]